MRHEFLVTVEVDSNISPRTVAQALTDGLEISALYWRQRLLCVTAKRVQHDENGKAVGI